MDPNETLKLIRKYAIEVTTGYDAPSIAESAALLVDMSLKHPKRYFGQV